MKWWGWGDPSKRVELPEASLRQLRAALGAEGRSEPVSLEDVRLDEPALPELTAERLRRVVGNAGFRTDRHARVTHAAGKGYPDLVRMRAGSIESAPDAVVCPESASQVRAILELCSHEGVAVVPFGGGTSVVGGVEPLRGELAAVISLDMRRMTGIEVDQQSLTAHLGPGLVGPEVEAGLARYGLTLGHFPQSFEYATVGGWAATRSAGQASTGYGKIEDMIIGIDCETPAGGIALDAIPASAAGPELRRILVGSEGVLGVITRVSATVRKRPEQSRYEGWMFRGFSEGAEALRSLEQRGIAPDVARLSDEVETAISMQSSRGSLAKRAGVAYLDARGYSGGCLMVVGFLGNTPTVARRRGQVARVLRSSGGLSLGTGPGKAWERQRYEGPYLRDALLDNRIMVETLETATQWSKLMDLYAAVRDGIAGALRRRGTPPLVMCHISHLYQSGASLYFTFMAAQEQGSELAQWQVAKSAATDAIVGTGGTITHHHAVGRDHAAWLPAEVGELGMDLLRAAKGAADPAGIMNPGKLVTSDARPEET